MCYSFRPLGPHGLAAATLASHGHVEDCDEESIMGAGTPARSREVLSGMICEIGVSTLCNLRFFGNIKSPMRKSPSDVTQQWMT